MFKSQNNTSRFRNIVFVFINFARLSKWYRPNIFLNMILATYKDVYWQSQSLEVDSVEASDTYTISPMSRLSGSYSLRQLRGDKLTPSRHIMWMLCPRCSEPWGDFFKRQVCISIFVINKKVIVYNLYQYI